MPSTELAGLVAGSWRQLPTPARRVRVGLSGGLDSTVLVHLLASLRQRLRKQGTVPRQGRTGLRCVFSREPVALPAQSGKHRLLHVHRNVPGVLSEINRIFSDNQINVSAQYLQTNEAIGYVVIDIDAESSELALQKLQQVPHTLRCRVLF